MKIVIRTFLFVTLLLALLGNPTVSEAAVGGSFDSGSVSGSVGTLIGAAMQTAGVHAHAKVLVNFKDGLKTLAALCYICALVGAIFSLSIFGNYSRALYFLVGPPLFYLMVNVTSTVDGANQQVGGDLRGSISDQQRFLKDFVHGADYGNAQVSTFFVMWDRLVSSVMQGVVDQIIRSGSKDDLVAKAREHYYSLLINFQPPESGYQRLVHQSLMGTCGKIFNNLWEARRHRVDSTNREITEANLDDKGKDLLKKYNEQKEFPQVSLAIDAMLMDGVKLTEVNKDHKRYSCKETWKRVETASKNYARNLLSDPRKYFDYSEDYAGIPYKRVKEDVERALTQEGHGSAEDILAGMIIRNTMKDGHMNAIYSNINERVPDNRTSATLTYSQAEMSASHGNFMRIMQFSKAIPYVQGLILYILSIAFPFFAVFLVMPGRARSFMVWMSLWVWVKSWDVGFALVSVGRKLMWSFVRSGVDRYAPNNVFAPHTKAQNTYNWDQPETILAVIFDNDPNATLNLYLTVVAALTVAVPLISAHFCLGATNMFGAFSGALDGVGNKWATQRRKMAHRANVASPTERLRDEYSGMGRTQGLIQALQSAVGMGGGSSGPKRGLTPGMGKGAGGGTHPPK